MKRFVFRCLILFVLPLFLYTCKDDGDTESPVINFKSPTNNQTIAIGSIGATLTVNAEFKDNEALKSYRIEITRLSSKLNGWDTTFTNLLSGTAENINFTLDLSHLVASDAGQYSFGLTCTDAADNVTSVARSINMVVGK